MSDGNPYRLFDLLPLRFRLLLLAALACGLLFFAFPARSAEADLVAAASRDWTALITMQDHAAISINAVVAAYQSALKERDYWREECQRTRCWDEPSEAEDKQ